MSEQPGRYQRSAAGMVGAMLVLVAVLVVFVAVRGLVRESPPSPVHAVDYRPQAAYARSQADFHVLAPTSLPDGWRVTQATYTPGVREHWHLGALTDHDRYVGLEQADQPVRSMLEQYVDPRPSRGQPVTVAGRRWSTWHDDGGDVALVRGGEGVTTLVVAHDVSHAELVDYVTRLR